MKILVNVPKNTALMHGSDIHGDVAVNVPAATLSELQRQTLAEYSSSGSCDYDLSYLTLSGCGAHIKGLAPATEATPDAVRDLLDRIADRLPAIKAEKEAERAKQVAERRAKAEQQARLPIGEQVAPCESYGGIDCRWRVISPLGDHDDLSAPAKAECERLRSDAVAAIEARRLAKEAAELEAAEERAAWIGRHGSSRLQRLAKEEIEHEAVYRDERLAHDLPDWVYDDDAITSAHGEPRNPPETALDLLDKARASRPAATLIYWTRDTDDGDETGYAAKDEFLGRTILLFAPAEE